MIYDYSGDGVETVFPKIGAFVCLGDDPFALVAFGVSKEIYDNGITYVTPHSMDGAVRSFPVDSDELTINEKTGTIEFRSNGIDYIVRELREEDGYWISSLQMPLSVPIMENMLEAARKRNFMAMIPGSDIEPEGEKLIAYAFDDSLYVVGLVYTNSLGRWIRSGADWILMGADDDTFKDAVAMEIDPDKADEYVDLYDANYVPVSDTEDFELADEEPVAANTPAETEKAEK